MRTLEPTGHGGEEDHGRPGGDFRVQPAERPDVLALDVDVHKGCYVAVLDELRPQPGEARHEVGEQLASDALQVLAEVAPTWAPGPVAYWRARALIEVGDAAGARPLLEPLKGGWKAVFHTNVKETAK